MADGTVVEDRDATKEAKAIARDEKAEREREYKEVRASDIEPYTGLRYLSKLFRFMAVILVLLLVAEVATGVYTQGSAAVPTLLGEASRLIVLAGVLWGTGDLAHLLIDVGHDVRAARILVARVAHAAKVAPLTAPRTGTEKTLAGGSTVATVDRVIPPRRNFADRLDNGDDEGPPIP
jgi:hypothetical protein